MPLSLHLVLLLYDRLESSTHFTFSTTCVGRGRIRLCHVLLIHALSRFSVANLFSCKHYSCVPRQSFKVSASLFSVTVLSVRWSELQALREDVPFESRSLMLLGYLVLLSRLREDWLHLLRLAEILLHWWAHGQVPLAKKKVKMNAAVLPKAFSNHREEGDWLFFSLPFFFSINC